jgi:hypothetical protein
MVFQFSRPAGELGARNGVKRTIEPGSSSHARMAAKIAP